MIRSNPTNNQPDAHRLPDHQLDYVSRLVTYMAERIGTQTAVERTIYTTIWVLIARISAPIVARNLNYKPEVIQAALDHLIAEKLLWYDPDLRAVLQCPPFSALHTPHEVKTFGWERAYVCSFVDAPLALLIYGPNTWMDVRSVCPRSGETLQFRIKLDDSYALHYEAPTEAVEWRVWVPASIESLMSLGVHGARARMAAFRSQADLDTHRHYNPEDEGVVYTLNQALYLSECLLHAYQRALATH